MKTGVRGLATLIDARVAVGILFELFELYYSSLCLNLSLTFGT